MKKSFKIGDNNPKDDDSNKGSDSTKTSFSLNQFTKKAILENITIDEEFKNLIPALSKEEYGMLKENILKSNKIKDPLVLWQVTENEEKEYILIDGHNRYKISQEINLKDFPIEVMQFENRELVREWIIRNQLGRRNLTPLQLSDFRGMLYNQMKGEQGGRNKNKEKTSDSLSEMFGVSPRTIERDGQFNKELGEIGKIDPEIKQDILSNKIKLPKEKITEIAQKYEKSDKGDTNIKENLRKEIEKQEKVDKKTDLGKQDKIDVAAIELKGFKLGKISDYSMEEIYGLLKKALKLLEEK